jgi:hypothetical protein
MPRRHVQICVEIAAIAVVGGLIAASARSAPPVTPATPVPGTVNEVPFDHTIHAGQYGIPCLDCHVYADKSPVAGLPSGRKCMGCHKFVAKDKPTIQLLGERVAAGRPLRWLRAFAVPDFIYFSHRMHVRAKVSCAECHGDIAAQKTIAQDRPFTMGRCIACHEERHATRDCLGCHK